MALFFWNPGPLSISDLLADRVSSAAAAMGRLGCRKHSRSAPEIGPFEYSLTYAIDHETINIDIIGQAFFNVDESWRPCRDSPVWSLVQLMQSSISSVCIQSKKKKDGGYRGKEVSSRVLGIALSLGNSVFFRLMLVFLSGKVRFFSTSASRVTCDSMVFLLSRISS
ncbi:hypothetical protein DL96DRAFT_1557112 [Flagelloscypha sp. PMI_526]|nr:hypothetical protein DL96DRAFT_1557112 [Flagelloscypha sp. PMI_526]